MNTPNLNYPMDKHTEEMNRRMAQGEFGEPVNLELLNKAWAQIVENEKGEDLVSITGLWTPERAGSKLAFTGRTKEDLTIPSGSKILVFNNLSEHENSPVYNLVFVSKRA